MIIYIASDHAGYVCKNMLIDYLYKDKDKDKDKDTCNTIINLGPYTNESCNYPDYANKLSSEIKNDNIFGILLCGTGIGMSIAANRNKHIRCALCHNAFTAEMSRLHNNANVLAIGVKYKNDIEIKEIVDTFINTSFSNEPRHINRINLLSE